MTQNKTLSIILLSYYSGERIIKSYRAVKQVLDKEHIPFEFIVMDDGSNDDSYATALRLEQEHDNVRAYQLSRNYTSHYSIFAGLSMARGGCAMPIPDDEQQPYETIVEAYRLWEKGEKIIVPYRNTRDDPWRSRIFSLAFYKIMNRYSEITFPPGGADVFFIDREVIDILNTRIHPIHTTTTTEVLRMGFKPYFLPFSRPLGLNEGKTRWSFKKRVRLAQDFFFTSSSFPIKFITRLGLFFSGLSMILIVLYLYIHLFGNTQFWGYSVPGWTSLFIAIVFFSGLILFSLGMIAEYIWRIYEEVKGRPGYIIKQKQEQSVDTESDR